jgi:D-alanyl-lipoteichoic acid acyltransferase DltB (MBOAT superfamily)
MYTSLLLKHAASWGFIVWGGLHGLALVVHRNWSQSTASKFVSNSAAAVVTFSIRNARLDSIPGK